MDQSEEYEPLRPSRTFSSSPSSVTRFASILPSSILTRSISSPWFRIQVVASECMWVSCAHAGGQSVMRAAEGRGQQRTSCRLFLSFLTLAASDFFFSCSCTSERSSVVRCLTISFVSFSTACCSANRVRSHRIGC